MKGWSLCAPHDITLLSSAKQGQNGLGGGCWKRGVAMDPHSIKSHRGVAAVMGGLPRRFKERRERRAWWRASGDMPSGVAGPGLRRGLDREGLGKRRCPGVDADCQDEEGGGVARTEERKTGVRVLSIGLQNSSTMPARASQRRIVPEYVVFSRV